MTVYKLEDELKEKNLVIEPDYLVANSTFSHYPKYSCFVLEEKYRIHSLLLYDKCSRVDNDSAYRQCPQNKTKYKMSINMFNWSKRYML